jgi:dihydrofolate synthase/folylpolyglutamate synthase
MLLTDDGVPVLLDGAHNPAAMRVLTRALYELHGDRRRVAVLGVMADKNIPAIVDLLGTAVDEVVVTTPDSPRAASAEQVAAACRAAGLTVAAQVEEVDAAVRAAAGRASGHGMVVVTGSLYTVGDARRALGGTLA